MNKTIATTILQFMQRVDLKGAEVPAFLQVTRELNIIINTPLDASKKETPEDTKEN